jgi:hypothetical protein
VGLGVGFLLDSIIGMSTQLYLFMEARESPSHYLFWGEMARPQLRLINLPKRKEICFRREQKLQPDRPHPDKEVVLRKTDFVFF